jgi:tRNA G37 N-methylase Trm5
VKKVLPKLKIKFNRIVMPLPKTAESYLPLALKSLKKSGVIHLYSFAQEKEFREIKEKYKKKFKSVKISKAGNYSPRVYRISLDLK